VMLGSGDPDGSAAAREAREVLGRLGASAYVERLESLLATGPAGARASTGARGDGGPSDVTQPRTASLSQG